jgi:Fe-S-cluster containining protein
MTETNDELQGKSPGTPPPAADTISPSELVRGLVYSHNRANSNTAAVHQANAAIGALVQILVEQGLVDGEAFQTRRAESAERLRTEYVERGMAVAMQEFGVSKYEFGCGAEIDCESRLPLCKAACCRLPFALSKEDVQEGIVKWDLGQPYMNARGADGYCAHLASGTCRCTIYGHRPIPCRGYDCRKDDRIWLDFEKMTINPRVNERPWPQDLPNSPPTSTGARVRHG